MISSNKKRLLTTKIWLIAITFSLGLVAPAQAKIIFNGDFESGTFKKWDTQEGCCKHSHTIIDSRIRSGKYAAKLTLKSSDPTGIGGKGRVRSEIKVNKKLDIDPAPKGSERWYSLSFFLDPQGDMSRVQIFQFHQRPDRGKSWGSPPFFVFHDNGQLVLRRFVRNKGEKKVDYNLGNIKPGQWIDLVFHAKWSDKNDGWLEAWVNGRKRLEYKGRTAWTDKERGKTGPYAKVGLYNGKSPVNKTTSIYIDDFRIGDENSSYQEVAAKGFRREPEERSSNRGSNTQPKSKPDSSSSSSNSKNLALRQPVSVSKEQKGNFGKNAVDGKANSQWSAQGYPQTLTIALGEDQQEINRLEIVPNKGRAYQFKALTGNGRLIVDRSKNTKGGNVLSVSFKPIKTKYLKLMITGCHGSSCSPNKWVSLKEVRVLRTE